MLFLALASGGAAQFGSSSPERIKLINADKVAGELQNGRIVRKMSGNVRMLHGETRISVSYTHLTLPTSG